MPGIAQPADGTLNDFGGQKSRVITQVVNFHSRTQRQSALLDDGPRIERGIHDMNARPYVGKIAEQTCPQI